MRRRLWMLNLTLAALSFAAAWQLRVRWQASRARSEAVLGRAIAAPGKGAPAESGAAPSLTGAAYLEVAEKMLFSRDRNPNVELDPPPAPRPMPALPLAYGVLLISDPPTAILSEKQGSPQRGFRPGDMIGEFRLIEVSNLEIEFEWEGKRVRRSLEDLTPSEAPGQVPAQSPTPPPAVAAAPTKTTTVISGSQAAPGPEGGTRACDPNDSSPEGTVQNGMRKGSVSTPFGKICRWDPVK